MKQGTAEHPKFSELRTLLGSPARYCIVGVLESLWMVTAQWKPAGDIGSFSDAQIGAAIGWEGDAGELVRALVKSRWLDEVSGPRLMVHDWHDHRPYYLKDRERKRKTEIHHGSSGKFLETPNHSAPNPTQPHKIHAAHAPPASQPDPETCVVANPPSHLPRKRRVPPTGPAAELERHFCGRWAERYGAEYPWKRGKDDAHNKWIRDQTKSPAHAKKIIDAFMHSEDKFVVKNRHTVGVLVSLFAQFLVPESGTQSEGTGFVRAENSDEIAAEILREGL